MHPLASRLALRSIVVCAALVLTACGSSADDSGAASGSNDSDKISVVASINVYGSIASAIGGNAVSVTSIITSPDQDPHSYEANTKTLLALSKAQLVVENGGGYDDFVDRMLTSHNDDVPVINAVDVSGHKAPPGGELNEHVWYDLRAIEKVADGIAARLGKIDPDHAAAYVDRADLFTTRVAALIKQEQQMRDRHAGEAIGITEPVPLYLTEAVGLVNETPADFSEAIEEGADVSPKVLDETLSLYRDRQVKALVYNQQTSGVETDKVKDAAEQAGIAVVPVTETLPAGQTYLSWMKSNLAALQSALDEQ